MPRFCANLGFLFGEVPFLDRFDAAARAGFTAVEYAAPYDYPAGELRTRLRDAGLTQVLINSPAGNRAAGERSLVYPVFPGELSASLGGNVATNAGGLCCLKYGVTRDYILGLRAVVGGPVAYGEAVRLGL